MNTINLKVKFELLFLLGMFTTTVFAQNFGSTLVKTSLEKNTIKEAIEKLNKDDEIDVSQIVKVTTTADYFFIAPVLSTQHEQEGCYIQTISADFKLRGKYLVEKSEDAQSCDAIQAIYSCKQSEVTGIGVISGVRLGADHYYSTNTFFNLNKSNELQINTKLTKLVGSAETVAKSKKILRCKK